VDLVGAGDLNNDGRGDLLATWLVGGDICLYRRYGRSTGDFGPRTLIGCGWQPYASLTGAGDLNNDGNADLIARTGPLPGNLDCLYRWYGNGSGGFGSGAQIGCGWDPYDDLTGLGDTTGDGRGDLVARLGDCLYRWNGNGAGGYASGEQIGCGWNAYYSWDLAS
jgi:hypothetical protein